MLDICFFLVMFPAAYAPDSGAVAALTVAVCLGAQAEDEYMISDVDLWVNKYVSVPKDMGGLTCAAFVAGIVKGCLDNAGFPARSSPPIHRALSYYALPAAAAALMFGVGPPLLNDALHFVAL